MKKKENGSMTVEASICLPVFLFAMILIGYLGQMIRCQDEVQSALSRVAKEAAAEYGMSKSNTIKSQAYYLAKMSLYLEGSAGKITFFQSRLLKENDEIDLIAGFRVYFFSGQLPISPARTYKGFYRCGAAGKGK